MENDLVEETGSKMRGETPNEALRTVRFRREFEIAGAPIVLAGETWLIPIAEEICFRVSGGSSVAIEAPDDDPGEDDYLEDLNRVATDDRPDSRSDLDLLRIGVEFLIRCLRMNYDLPDDEVEKVVNRSILETEAAIEACVITRFLPSSRLKFVISMIRLGNRWVRDHPEFAERIETATQADRIPDPPTETNPENPECLSEIP